MSTPTPGGERQAATRNVLRAGGTVLAVVGVLLVIVGFGTFVTSMDGFDGPPTWSFLAFAGGGFMAVIGFGMASAGYQGAVARFTAGEQAPVLKDTAHYLSDGDGVFGVGRTRSDSVGARETGAGAATGPYCRQCGTRNDADARFCDSCGTSLA